ncbi:MAG: aminomethyl-transferring glycine dehydrogenase subunit GcvPB [Nitrospirae bacterium]|nr:aminomethyl-transferring glycine dehydrogenase subunit GcvPB [Nitrospirota bacterium]
MDNLLIFERGTPGRAGVDMPACDVPERQISELIPEVYLRTVPPGLPEVSEPELVRHYTGLSRLNYSVDSNFYPLGSCTMKYNPKVNDDAAALSGFDSLHPLQSEETTQGALRLMYELEQCLKEIGGLARVSLQPAAGAGGEFTGMLIVRAYLEARGDRRDKVIIPDSAHGTNPASAHLAGFHVLEVKSGADGLVDLSELRKLVGPDTAGFMLTVPNTLGLFEKDIVEIARIIHGAGGLMYMDGANMNALVGLVRPGDMGFDVVHFNLHKTFSTPHGGGGPGAGPVGVSEALVPYLPAPTVEFDGTRYRLDNDRPHSVGRVQAFNGNFGVLVRAYAYIRSLGPDGLAAVSENAIINANYLLARLRGHYQLAHERHCMHEVVFSGHRQKEHGVHTRDIAKRLLDHGFYAPTVYFPLVVEEAIMIEPTETETRQTLDAFVDAMISIANEAEASPDVLTSAPHTTPVARLDETLAARRPVIRYRKPLTPHWRSPLTPSPLSR